jgi:hypothetical protein
MASTVVAQMTTSPPIAPPMMGPSGCAVLVLAAVVLGRGDVVTGAAAALLDEVTLSDTDVVDDGNVVRVGDRVVVAAAAVGETR